jgi:hypothetical protein
VRWLALTAADSRNRAFLLCFEPVAGGTEQRRLAVRFDGRDFTWCSGHRVGDATWHRAITVDPEDAERVAAAAGLAPAAYAGRDVELDVRAAAESDVYAIGDAIRMRLTVRNTGDAPLSWTFGGWQRAANRHGRMRFWCWRDGVELAVVGETQSLGGLAIVKTLAAGESIEEVEDLGAWFDLSQAGDYRVRVEYDLPIVEPLPRMSRASVCPRVASECTEILDAELAFRVR